MFRVLGGSSSTDTGYLYIVDWDTKEQLVEPIEVRVTEKSKRASGRSYGCRGITWYQDKVCVAGSNNTLQFCDPDTYEISSNISFGSKLAHIHQIRSHEEKLYICNTGYA